jgi:diketogulonate reductase-like aldo/keto reductase
VSNFGVEELKALLATAKVKPAVNQVSAFKG